MAVLPFLTTIAGADYSAAQVQPNATWLALGQACAGENCTLSIYKLERVGSDRLGQELLNSGAALAGLDFPFSWPAEFIDFVAGGVGDECVDEVAGSFLKKNRRISLKISTAPFEKLQAQALAFGREPRRAIDHLTQPKGQSPLHRINPGMLKMTWQGGALLDQLRSGGFCIAPFDRQWEENLAELPGQSQMRTALEVYPAATLASLGLPYRKYKGREPSAKLLRSEILHHLTRLHTVNRSAKSPARQLVVELPADLAALAQYCDDALDAVLACHSAFLAIIEPELVQPGPVLARHKSGQALTGAGKNLPPTNQEQDLLAEGWIYSPYGF